MKSLETVLKALSDTNRLRIVKLLEQKRMCVCELAAVLAISQPAVSKHLKKLQNAGLVQSEQDGFWTNYLLSGKNVYAHELLRKVAIWLNDDACIAGDRVQAGRINRQEVCKR